MYDFCLYVYMHYIAYLIIWLDGQLTATVGKTLGCNQVATWTRNSTFMKWNSDMLLLKGNMDLFFIDKWYENDTKVSGNPRPKQLVAIKLLLAKLSLQRTWS